MLGNELVCFLALIKIVLYLFRLESENLFSEIEKLKRVTEEKEIHCSEENKKLAKSNEEISKNIQKMKEDIKNMKEEIEEFDFVFNCAKKLRPYLEKTKEYNFGSEEED